MGTFVAGPYAGALLAELGADVIKVEPPSGDPFRVSGFVFNRGMRSLSVNLQAQAGVDAFRRLARASDVVIDMMRPGVAAKLGIDYETLSDGHPGLIEVSLSAYGEGGPLGGRPSVDMVVQGMSGMMMAQGGRLRARRQHDRDHRRHHRRDARPRRRARLASPRARPGRGAGRRCRPGTARLGVAGRERHLPANRGDRPLRRSAARGDRRAGLRRRGAVRPLLPGERRVGQAPRTAP